MYTRRTAQYYKSLFWQSIVKFFKGYTQVHSAALAFYMIFSLPSILLIILWIAARFDKEIVVRAAIFKEIGSLVGQRGAQQLLDTAERIHIHDPSISATIIGFTVLLFTATNVFITMKISLNSIFEVQQIPGKLISVRALLFERLVSVVLIIAMSLLLLVLVGLDAILNSFGSYTIEWFGTAAVYVMKFDSFIIELFLTTVLFVIFFRYLPATKLELKHTWLGAFVTSLMLAAGEYLIGYFLGNRTVANLYEAAGSVLLLMLWVYYASSIFLFGAIMTFVHSQLFTAKPKSDNPQRGISSFTK
jgi:membrane protein